MVDDLGDGLGVCPRCGGEGVIGEAGATPCPLCKGMGAIGDSGPPPAPDARGLLAVRPCGCAHDWIGADATHDARARKLVSWEAQGSTWSETDFATAGPAMTRGSQCPHDRRATPREAAPVLDLSDVPPSPYGVRLPPRSRIVAVSLEDPSEDAEHGDGGIVAVTLRCELENGEVRMFNLALDDLPEPPADFGSEGA